MQISVARLFIPCKDLGALKTDHRSLQAYLIPIRECLSSQQIVWIGKERSYQVFFKTYSVAEACAKAFDKKSMKVHGVYCVVIDGKPEDFVFTKLNEVFPGFSPRYPK